MLAAAADFATPYCTLLDKLGQIETISNDGAVSRLAAACRLRAVDQKYDSDSDILLLADRRLEQPDDEEGMIAVVKA